MEIKEKKNILSATALSVLLTVLCIVAAFGISNMLPGQKLVFLKSDSLSQYTAFARMFWRHLIKHESIAWSFQLGMGAPSWVHYSLFLSPLNVFYALINDINTAGFIVYLLKLSLSAAFFSLFLSECVKCDTWINITFSLLYALSGYGISNYDEMLVLENLYILPLICRYIYRLHKDGRWKGLCLCYSYSFIVFFYGAYQSGIFSFILFICMGGYLLNDRKNWKRSISGYIKSVVIAVLISGIVVIPEFFKLILDMGGSESAFENWRSYPWEHITHILTGVGIERYQDVPLLYCGMLTPILMLYFLSGKEPSRKRICLIMPLLFVILCSYFAPAYLAIHGFDNPDGITFRFTFYYVFVACLYAALATKKAVHNRKVFLICGLVISVSIISVCINNRFPRYGTVDSFIVEIAVLFAVVEVIAFCKGRDYRIGRFIIVIVVALDCFINAVLTIRPASQVSFSDLSEYMDMWTRQAGDALQYLEQNDRYGKEAFRADFENSPMSNVAVLTGIRSEQLFSSLDNRKIRKTMYDLGYMAFEKCLSNTGATAPTRMLFSAGYTIHFSNPRFEEESDTYIDTQEVLPIAFMVSDNINNYSTIEGKPFENINGLISSMCGRNISVFDQYAGEIHLNNDNMTVSTSEDGKILFELIDKSQSGKTEIITPEDGGAEYIYFSQSGSEYNYESANIYSETEWGTMSFPPLMKAPFILKMTDRDGSYRCNVYLNPELAISDSCESISLAALDEEQLDVAYSELSPGAMNVESINESEIDGHISVSGDKELMFTSIPYDTGWEAYVDGNKTETTAVMDGSFLAVKLGQGEHDIVLRYRDKHLEAGCIVSVLGVMLLLFSVWRGRSGSKIPA